MVERCIESRRPSLALVSDKSLALARKSSALHLSFDMLCALIGLSVLSPLLLVIALAIRLQNDGPVLYAQSRVGRHFRLFRVLKFRTMVEGADRAGLLTSAADSRITRVGRVLRTYKLDELPQLWNVLKGEMQLVGPRPEVKRYVEMFRSQFALLLQDRPGITDPASIAYRREDTLLPVDSPDNEYVSRVLPAKLQLSLDYQRRRTFISDLQLLMRTIRKVFT